jgi:hypothetical protein
MNTGAASLSDQHIEQYQAEQAAQSMGEPKRGTDAQILYERELTVSAINGAMAFGHQNTNPPPSDDHWLAPFWKIGRKQAELEAAIAAGGAQEPYAYVYEYDTEFGLHRQFEPGTYNGANPSRTVKVYAAPLPRVAATVMPDDTSAFKNFHRQLCERFGYVHDEKDWRRDQVSLIECIAKKLETAEKDSARYRRFRRWHPRLQTSYWTGKWWEPIYGEKMDVCVDWLDEVPQPTPHADQCDSAAPAASNGEQA